MKKILFYSLFAIFALLLLQPAPTPVLAQTQPDCSAMPADNTCPDDWTAVQCMRCFSERTGYEARLTDVDKPLPEIIGDLIRGLLGFLGVIFLILIIYGGFLWMTSAGNEDRISKAKKIIANSAIGLFIVVISFALTTFIFDVIIQATGSA